MRLLVLDTALDSCSVAFLDTVEGRSVAKTRVMQRGHVEALPSMVDDVMHHSGCSFSAIDRFAVTLGPGSFTGLRVGLAAARGFSLALQRPLLGIGTLHLLAMTLLSGEDPPTGPFEVAIPASGQELYCQRFAENAKPLNEPRVMRQDCAFSDADSFFIYSSNNEGSGWARPFQRPGDPAILAVMAADLPVPAVPVRLLYLRAAAISSA